MNTVHRFPLRAHIRAFVCVRIKRSTIRIIIILLMSVLRQVRRLFKSDSPQIVISCSSFSLQYPVISLESFSSCLRLLARPSVTYILPFTFYSVLCFRWQLLRKMWPFQLAFLLFIVCLIFLSSLTPIKHIRRIYIIPYMYKRKKRLCQERKIDA